MMREDKREKYEFKRRGEDQMFTFTDHSLSGQVKKEEGFTF